MADDESCESRPQARVEIQRYVLAEKHHVTSTCSLASSLHVSKQATYLRWFIPCLSRAPMLNFATSSSSTCSFLFMRMPRHRGVVGGSPADLRPRLTFRTRTQVSTFFFYTSAHLHQSTTLPGAQSAAAPRINTFTHSFRNIITQPGKHGRSCI